MKVYRYLSKNELQSILSDNNAQIGTSFRKKFFHRVNTHKYRKEEKYLHFFEKKDDIFLIQIEHQNIPADFYICEFDIPEKHLIKGFGFYESASGYEYYKVKIKEFILPTKLFKSSWLQNFEIDKNHSTGLPEMAK